MFNGSGSHLKHALVVGNIRHPHEQLINNGYRITWFTERDITLVPDQDDIRRCEQIVMYNPILDEPELLTMILAIHKTIPIDLVCSFHDTGQRLAVSAAKALGLEFKLNLEAIKNANDKWYMRQTLEQNNLNGVRSSVVTKLSDLADFFNTNSDIEEAILKPLSGTGSRDVMLVSRQDYTNEEVSQILQNEEKFLIEEFIHGAEYSVEGFTVNGEHHILAVTEKFKQSGSFMENGHLVPARISSEQHDKIVKYVTKCLTVLGINTGPSHSEVILGPRGPILVETHTRTGGDKIPNLVELAYGIDIYRASGLAIINEGPKAEELIAYNNNLFACSKFLVQNVSGKIKEVKGVDAAKASKGVIQAGASFAPGEHLPVVKHSFDRGAMVIATGLTAERAISNAQKALSKIEYVLEQDDL